MDELARHRENLRYSIGLKFRHPTWHVSRFTEAMGCDPEHSYSFGEEYRVGKAVKLRAISYWCFSRQRDGERRFFKEFIAICDWLTTKKSFLDEVLASGGTVTVDIALRGTDNIGSELNFEYLRRAGELGISLGIEVFPKMNTEKNKLVPWDPC